MNQDLMRQIEQVDPVREGVFVARSLDVISCDEDMTILRGNIGPGVDVFITHYRNGAFGQMMVRATGKTYTQCKQAIDASGEVPKKL